MESKEKLIQDNLENGKIKREAGTSQPPVLQRLPSLKAPRDLTLSAYRNIINPNSVSKKNKIYIPNFNVQRNKTSETPTSKPKQEPVKPNSSQKKENVKSQGKKNFVQLDQGVFAQGVPGQKNVGQGRVSSGSSSNNNVLKKPVLNFKTPIKVDKKEEEELMKKLLQDDFIDDPSLEPNYNHCPVVIPFSKKVDSFKKKGIETKVDVKNNRYQSVKELFDSATTTDPGFVYFQMPCSIPGLKAQDETKGKSTASTSTDKPVDNKPNIEQCPLSCLPEGRIGKLQILKSGRARLVLGDIKMWVDMGTQPSCKQEDVFEIIAVLNQVLSCEILNVDKIAPGVMPGCVLQSSITNEDVVSIQLDKETFTGHTYNLGPMKMRMIVTPDLERLLPTHKLNSTLISHPNPVLQ